MPMLLVPALGGLGISGAVAGPLSSILFTGLSIILSILFKPKVPKPDDGHTPFKQPIPNRIRILGKRRTGGAWMLRHSYRQSTLYEVIAICDGEIGAFTSHWLHEDSIEFLPDGHTVSGVTVHGPGRYGNGKVRIYHRFGLPTETSYTIDVLDAHTRLDVELGIWGDNHRGDGIGSLMCIYADAGQDDQAARFPFGPPLASAEVIATRIFDPRRASGGTGSAFGSGSEGTGSGGGQDYRDPTTWKFSGNDNPILQTMWYVTAPISHGGLGLDFEEAFLPVLGDVASQADICDEEVPLKGGGTVKRYRSGALFKYSDDPSEVLAAILGTCDGFLAERGDGAFELRAGKWQDDDFDVIIKDKHIISLHVTRFRPDEDDVTGVIVKYNSLVHSHQVVDAPVWPRDAYQGGEDRRIRTIEVTYCPEGTQAQRISKRVAIYEMAPIRGTAVLNMYGVLLLDRRGCTIQCTDDPALADAKCRLTRLETNLKERTVTIDFTVFDPVECDEWDPATEQGPLQPVVNVPYNDISNVPANVTPVASQINDAVIVDVSFDPGTGASTSWKFTCRFRIADTGGGIPGGWSEQDFSPSQVERPESDRWIITLNSVPIVSSLEVQVREGQPSFSTSGFCNTRNPAPGRPTSFTATLVGADVQLDWISPNSSNFDHARVYRNIHGGGFDLATDISGVVTGGTPVPAPMTFTDIAPPSGHLDYWVVAENTLNVPSTSAGPEDVIVP